MTIEPEGVVETALTPIVNSAAQAPTILRQREVVQWLRAIHAYRRERDVTYWLNELRVFWEKHKDGKNFFNASVEPYRKSAQYFKNQLDEFDSKLTDPSISKVTQKNISYQVDSTKEAYLNTQTKYEAQFKIYKVKVAEDESLELIREFDRFFDANTKQWLNAVCESDSVPGFLTDIRTFRNSPL